jgi:hypothetical protein
VSDLSSNSAAKLRTGGDFGACSAVYSFDSTSDLFAYVRTCKAVYTLASLVVPIVSIYVASNFNLVGFLALISFCYIYPII